MKKPSFDLVFKVIILIFASYSLYLLTVILSNSDNGRYQFKPGSELILDTKTGKIYYNEGGHLLEYGK